MFRKILGGLLGGATGDAMGAATEGRTTEQIKAYFKHTVTDFEVTPMDTFGAGNRPGQVTDDFSSAYFLARKIADDGGLITTKAVQEALIEWSGHPVFFDRFAGPTTRLAIQRFKEGASEIEGDIDQTCRQATNGAAMKISPIGLLSGGNIDRAIEDAAVVTMVTHDNYLAVSGACAVAAAVSRSLTPGADVYSVIQAGLYGARKGEQIGMERGKDTPGPSVYRRMGLAVELGLGVGTKKEKMIEISQIIGTGLHISEAVPAAFGFLAANDGNPMGTIISSVNSGYDTDTVATIAGAIAGTLAGADGFPEGYLGILEQANGLPIEQLARDICKIAEKEAERQ